MGNDVVGLVLDFFGSMSLSELNEAFFVLIPKVKKRIQLRNLDMCLCNVVYKLISNTLTNKLKFMLLSIISDSQSTLIKNRLITNNGLLDMKSLHSMHM